MPQFHPHIPIDTVQISIWSIDDDSHGVEVVEGFPNVRAIEAFSSAYGVVKVTRTPKP